MKWRRGFFRSSVASLAAAVLPLGMLSVSLPGGATAASGSQIEPPPVRQVVVISLDNTHLADIEQMPAVMRFFAGGTLFSNDHTGLIDRSHADYVTEATGDYPDRTGIVGQSQYDGGQRVGFRYWPDKTSGGLAVHLVAPPWVYWNGLGDAVGVVGWADMALETKQDVSTYGVQVAPGKTADNYLGYAPHNADGSSVFGAPNLPYVEDAPLLLDGQRTVGDFSGSFDANFGPDRSLSAVDALLTHGTGVVYDYIRTVHESASGTSLPPGSSRYQANLAHYNAAFAAFFADLAKHGITPANTLFLLTSDEGDDLSPGGALTTGLQGQLTNLGFSLSKAHLVAASTALLYWPVAVQEPVTRLADVPGWRYIAQDQVLRVIHAVPADPAYDPQVAIFAEPDWTYGGGDDMSITTREADYWTDGTVARDMNALWVGLVGPGVPAGRESREWVDSTDILPTLQRLVTGTVQPGLQGLAMVDAGSADGGQAQGQAELRTLTELYKQLDAPLGSFSRAVLQVGTTAVVEPNLRKPLDEGLTGLIAKREAVASQLHPLLRSADSGIALDSATASQLAGEARAVIAAARGLADKALLR